MIKTFINANKYNIIFEENNSGDNILYAYTKNL